jgi:hypothetical protein
MTKEDFIAEVVSRHAVTAYGMLPPPSEVLRQENQNTKVSVALRFFVFFFWPPSGLCYVVSYGCLPYFISCLMVLAVHGAFGCF